MKYLFSGAQFWKGLLLMVKTDDRSMFHELSSSVDGVGEGRSKRVFCSEGVEKIVV